MLLLQSLTNKLYIRYKFKEELLKYDDIKKASRLPLLEIEKRQLKKLNKILNYAYKNNPYYKKILRESYNIEKGKINLTDLSELQAMPFLTKDIIRNEKEKLYSINHQQRGSQKNTSGGSTGEPVKFLQDDLYRLENTANFFLVQSWKGAEPYDSNITLWGATRDTFEGKKPISTHIKDFFRNRSVLNCFKISNDDIRKYITILNKHKPKVIIAYAQSIYLIAKYARDNKLQVEKQNAIHTSAETLYDFKRDAIESAFQCKVFNHYGSREVGPIASECSHHNGLHIIMGHTLVEVVNEYGESSKPGEKGEIVVTNLNNYSMPLIRYKIGDVGVMQEYSNCGCGCNYPKLEKVVGRTTDIFKTRAGDLIDGHYFINIFYLFEGIKNIQVIQKALDKVIIRIVKEENFSDSLLKTAEERIKLVMGDDCDVIFDFVNEIPKTKTGKHLYIISEL